MRLPAIAAYVLLLLAADAAVGSVPPFIVRREGGGGIGSALILPVAAQVAAIPLGAALAAVQLDRRAQWAVPLLGALLVGAGLLAIALQPIEGLPWILSAQTASGIGLGMLLTAAFAAVAWLGARDRPLAVVVLLITPVVARGVNAFLALSGPLGLTVAAGIVIVLSVVTVGLIGGRHVDTSPSVETSTSPSRGAAALGGLLISLGALATIGAADPSRVIVALAVSPIGAAGLESLDAWRAGLLLAGVLLVAVGISLLLARRALGRPILAATGAIALAAFAGLGMATAISTLLGSGSAISTDRGVPLVGAAGAVASVIGLAGGGWWLARGGAARTVASAGLLLLVAGTLLGAAGLAIASSEPPSRVAALGGISCAALGGGIAAAALRLVLAAAPPPSRGLAAAGGVMAASIGAVLGALVGSGEALSLASGRAGLPIGLVILPVAAAVAVAAARGGGTQQGTSV